MEFVDSHAHPQFSNFSDDAYEVLATAAKDGVKRVIAVGTTLEDSQKAAEFVVARKNVWATAGVHPHAAREFLELADATLDLRALLTRPKVVAVGEIGLDYYKSYSTIEEQESVLRAQIEVGLSSGLPFIFHVRDAWEAFWRILDDFKDIRGVVHSFSAHAEQLDQVLSRGLYVGLNGIMTFTKDDKQLEAAKKVPIDKLLLETDAPFLAPPPFRGQRCEPKHTKLVAEFLAELRGESLEKMATETTKNAVVLFGLENQ